MNYVVIIRNLNNERVEAAGFHFIGDAVRQAKKAMLNGKRVELVTASVFADMRRRDILPKLKNRSPFDGSWEWEG